MNFLPFVAIFLCILTMSYNGFFHSHTITQYSHICSSSFSTTLRKARDEAERQTYLLSSNSKGKNNTTPAPSPARSSKKKGAYISTRTIRFSDNSKLNITTLFKEDDPRLRNALVSLIDTLYHDAPFYKEYPFGSDKFAIHLVNQLLLDGGKLTADEITFTSIILSDPKLKNLWYKVLKGCTYYNLDKGEGWPPLSDFVMIHPDVNRKAICFKKAAPVVLEAFFGTDVTSAILEEEKKRYFSDEYKTAILDEKGVNQLLGKHSINFSSNYLQFNYHKKSKNVIRAVDPKTSIVVEIQNRVVTKDPKLNEEMNETEK